MKISFKFRFKWNSRFRTRNPIKALKFIPEEANSKWDEIEIHPIFEDENGLCEVVDEGDEKFWSVYLHQVSGGLRCIADLPTKNDAIKFKQLLNEAFKMRNHKSLHL